MNGESSVRSLGEIALQVSDLGRMEAFYAQVVGLRRLRRFPHSVFFEIAPGYAGHIVILALFDRVGQGVRVQSPQGPGSLDHLAFAIHRDNFAKEKVRLEGLGLKLDFAVHNWVQWRSLYFSDPEGNRVEFVCHDPEVPPEANELSPAPAGR